MAFRKTLGRKMQMGSIQKWNSTTTYLGHCSQHLKMGTLLAVFPPALADSFVASNQARCYEFCQFKAVCLSLARPVFTALGLALILAAKRSPHFHLRHACWHHSEPSPDSRKPLPRYQKAELSKLDHPSTGCSPQRVCPILYKDLDRHEMDFLDVWLFFLLASLFIFAAASFFFTFFPSAFFFSFFSC